MSFEREGWLGDAAEAFVGRCEVDCTEVLALVRRVNKLAHETLGSLKIKKDSPRQLLASALFLRMLESMQATVHLVRLGFRHDAAVIIRVSIENLILLKNACENISFAKGYVSRGSLHALKNTRRGLPDEARAQLDRDLRDRLESAERRLADMLEELGNDNTRIQKLAADVGLAELYNTAYSLFSASVHSESGVIAGYFEELPDGSVGAIDYSPDWRYAGVYLATASDLLLRALESLEKMFGGDRAREREALVTELKELSPPWPDPKRKHV